jgi:hypothetical protein
MICVFPFAPRADCASCARAVYLSNAMANSIGGNFRRKGETAQVTREAMVRCEGSNQYASQRSVFLGALAEMNGGTWLISFSLVSVSST